MTRAASKARLTQVSSNGVLCPHKNLVITDATVATVDIDADELVLSGDTDSNEKILVESVNLTVTISSSGANGLDTGSEASSTWYHLWVIHNPSTNTTAGLASTSSTAPTMPSSYTYKGYVGAIYNDSGSDFDPIIQLNDRVNREYVTVLTDGSSLSATSVSLTSAVPSTAAKTHGNMVTTSDTVEGASTAYLYTESTGSLIAVVHQGAGGNIANDNESGYFEIGLPTAQSIWYKATATSTNVDVHILGWSY